MPIIKYFPPMEPPHDCAIPDHEEYGEGTLYLCDKCGRVYELDTWVFPLWERVMWPRSYFIRRNYRKMMSGD